MYIPKISKTNIKSHTDLIQEIEILGVETIELEDGNFLFNVKGLNCNFMCKVSNENYTILTKNNSLSSYVVMYSGISADDVIYALGNSEITKVTEFSVDEYTKYSTSDLNNAILYNIMKSGSSGNIQVDTTMNDRNIYYIGIDNKLTIYRDHSIELNSVQLGTHIIQGLPKREVISIFENLQSLVKNY